MNVCRNTGEFGILSGDSALNYKELENIFLYCGPQGFSCSLFHGSPKIKSVVSWFKNVETYYVHKARTGIHRALELINISEGDEILVPSYNCGSEIDTLIYNGAKVVPYRVDRDCKIDIADLISRISLKSKAIYVIHYFGFPQEIKIINNICKEHKLYLIEDCALSLFSSDNMGILGTQGDISIYSFPKTLPVPDGGLLAINNINLKRNNWELSLPRYRIYFKNIVKLTNSMFLRKYIPGIIAKILYYCRYMLKYKKNRSNTLFEKYPGIPNDYYYVESNTNKSISSISMHILNRIDYKNVINRRRENFILYKKLLEDVDIISPIFKILPEEVCPLYYPIIIQNRDNICQELNKLSIYAISWWSGYHPRIYWDKYPDACFLKNNTLVLPVHQDLSKSNITHIVSILKYIININGSVPINLIIINILLLL